MYHLRFSMQCPNDGRSDTEQAAARTVAYQTAIDMVAWGEANGNLAAILSEHHASPDGYLPSPLILASAMAARTNSTMIVVAALLGLLYDPMRLAEDLAVLDHVSGGRVMCVVGMGYRDEEYRLFGVDKKTRALQMDELLTTLRRAWRGETFDYADRGTVRVTPAPATTGGPALAYGGHSEAAARRAARHGLAFVAEAGGDHLQRAYDDEGQSTGIVGPGCQLTAPGTPTTEFVAEQPDAAWAELGPLMLQEIRVYREWNDGAGKSAIASLSTADSVDELRAEEGAYRIYCPDEAATMVAGGRMLSLEPLCGGLAPDRAWHYLHTAAAAVAPAS